PFSDRGTSTQPVNWLSAFQVLSPCRSRIKVEVMADIVPQHGPTHRVGSERPGRRSPCRSPDGLCKRHPLHNAVDQPVGHAFRAEPSTSTHSPNAVDQPVGHASRAEPSTSTHLPNTVDQTVVASSRADLRPTTR